MGLISHQKVVRQVWIFSQCSLKLATKLQAYLFVPINQRMHSSQSVWAKIQVCETHLSDMPNTWTCWRADRLGLRPRIGNTWAIFWGVRTVDGRPGGLLHATEPAMRLSFWSEEWSGTPLSHRVAVDFRSPFPSLLVRAI